MTFFCLRPFVNPGPGEKSTLEKLCGEKTSGESPQISPVEKTPQPVSQPVDKSPHPFVGTVENSPQFYTTLYKMYKCIQISKKASISCNNI